MSAGIEWLLISDVDDTLVGNPDALNRFVEFARRTDGFAYVLNSSRPISSIRRTLESLVEPVEPVAIIGAMGTEIWSCRVAEGIGPDRRWSARFASWSRDCVDEVLGSFKATPHDDEFQTPYKASYRVEPELIAQVRRALSTLRQPCKVVVSGETDFDVLPPNAGKGAAASYCIERFGHTQTRSVAAGDSANDIDLFGATDFGIVVGNARDELKSAVDSRSSYLARASFADGILEGLEYWASHTNENNQVATDDE